ncbi:MULTISPECIES: DUF6584 family protein [unclassified Streptomyces]|uniref:DUF6584 family protein n=1 Tax=unclassified Streptomyces TaxID=2593676 RepID=UPI0029671CBC|nr:DUF6584 family protein [Streptomyces sp. SJL17-1]
MSPLNTLARVDADLASGRVPMARQRLRGLVSSFPCDLMLRRRLAEVYRLYGDAAEAGRWMYLEADRDEEETAAFEARYGTPGWRMKALAWRGPEASAATRFAEEQLVAVRTACAEWLGRPVAWDDDPESYVEDPDEESAPEPGGSTLSGVIVGAGALAGIVVMSGIWVLGIISLFS